jgi:hypothetical protein
MWRSRPRSAKSPFVRAVNQRTGNTGNILKGAKPADLPVLRELQRRHGTAVLVVHHARKGGGGVRAGQALRGRPQSA